MNPKRSLLAKAVLLTAGMSTLMLPGCVIVPIPDRKIEQREFDRNVDEQSRLLLIPGKTTRKEVLLKLGQPDGFSDDERMFWYIADVTEEGQLWRFALILVGPPYGAWGGVSDPTQPTQYEKYRLTINFDDSGKVKDSSFVRSEHRK